MHEGEEKARSWTVPCLFQRSVFNAMLSHGIGNLAKAEVLWEEEFSTSLHFRASDTVLGFKAACMRLELFGEVSCH